MSAQRDDKGRFKRGQSGNPGGQYKQSTEERVAGLVARETPELLARAFKRAHEDDAVLANLLGFLGAALGERGIANLSSELAQLSARNSVHH